MAKKCPHCDKYLNGQVVKCKTCEKDFITIRDGLYCSNACKQKDYRKRKPTSPDSVS